MSDKKVTEIKVRLWGSGGKVYTKVYKGEGMYYTVQEKTGALRIFQRTWFERASAYGPSYRDETLAYHSANAWHTVEG